MGRIKKCPFSKWHEAFIELPDEWLGIHAERRDEAVDAAEKRGVKGAVLVQFAIALNLLDDWGEIPGLDGPPEKWRFHEVPLEIIGWINLVVITEFAECFEVPKKSSEPSPNGLTAKLEGVAQPGDLETPTAP